MTYRNQIVGYHNWATKLWIGTPKSHSEVVGVNLAEPNERVMSYLGRSWTSFVLLEAKKSAEVIVGAQTLSNAPSVWKEKKKEIGQERQTLKD